MEHEKPLSQQHRHLTGATADASGTTLVTEPETMDSENRRPSVALDTDRQDSTEGMRRRSQIRKETNLSSRSNAPTFLQRVATGLKEPGRKIAREPTTRESLIAIVKCSWLNVLLPFIPVSWALHFAKVNDTIIFVTSLIAIVPLAQLLGFGTEEISMRLGETVGGLLNATLGNVVELLVAILALAKCELQIVQASLLGSIISNLLLVLGMCFFTGGLKFSEQQFGSPNAQISSSLLVISVVAILLPAGFHAAFQESVPDAVERADVLAMSRAAAVILLVTYIMFMIFQLWSHKHVFNPDSAGSPTMGTRKMGKHTFFQEAKSMRRGQAVMADIETNEEEEEEEQPQMNLWVTIVFLLVIAVLVGITAEWLVDSISGLTEGTGVSPAWIGLIVLPIAGNAAEHWTAVTVSYKDKLDLSISVAVGSSIQIALFVLPLLIIIAWIMDKPLSMLFDPFESVSVFLAVLLANYTMADSRSNWLEGWILMSCYIIIAVSFYYFPSGTTPEQALLAC